MKKAMRRKQLKLQSGKTQKQLYTKLPKKLQNIKVQNWKPKKLFLKSPNMFMISIACQLLSHAKLLEILNISRSMAEVLQTDLQRKFTKNTFLQNLKQRNIRKKNSVETSGSQVKFHSRKQIKLSWSTLLKQVLRKELKNMYPKNTNLKLTRKKNLFLYTLQIWTIYSPSQKSQKSKQLAIPSSK